MNFDDFILYGKQLTSSDETPSQPSVTFDHLRKLMQSIPQPTVWEIGPIYVIGLPGSVHQFIRVMEHATKPAEPPSMLGNYMAIAGPRIIAMPSNVFPDADYVLLNAGKEFRKVYLIGFDEFMKRWKRDGEELAALIERLEGYSR